MTNDEKILLRLERLEQLLNEATQEADRLLALANEQVALAKALDVEIRRRVRQLPKD